MTFTLSEAADHYNVSKKTIVRWAKSGKLDRVLPGIDVLDSIPYHYWEINHVSRGVCSCPPRSSNARKTP
jgi:excisionase family DNA binding protein